MPGGQFNKFNTVQEYKQISNMQIETRPTLFLSKNWTIDRYVVQFRDYGSTILTSNAA